MTAEFSPGRWIQQRRRALGLTQKELGQRVGCAAETVRKIEADARRPSRQVATLLAHALELPASGHSTFVSVIRGEQPVDTFLLIRTPLEDLTFVFRSRQPLLPVTFLFADIGDSLRLWQRVPQAMSLTLMRFKEILHRIIVAYDGQVLFRTVEKGVCAAFAGPLDALAAAEAAQQAIQVESWGETGPLRVRMALHTGVAARGKDDYFGPPLEYVAQLLAVGHGDQILLSRTVVELVGDWLPSAAHICDLGLHSLKDLAQPEHVYLYRAADKPVPIFDEAPDEAYEYERRPFPLEEEMYSPDVMQVETELIAVFANGAWFVPSATNSDPDQVSSE